MTFDLLDFLTQAKRRADENVRRRNRKTEYDRFMKSDTWEHLRSLKLRQARNRCEKCGDTERLEVHHLTYDRFGGDERMTDLQVLCHTCHEDAHGREF